MVCDKAKYIFPNVRKFDFSDFGDGEHVVDDLALFFESLDGWNKLEILEISLWSKTSVGDLLIAMESLDVEGLSHYWANISRKRLNGLFFRVETYQDISLQYRLARKTTTGGARKREFTENEKSSDVGNSWEGNTWTDDN